jgi:hypothetical protein
MYKVLCTVQLSRSTRGSVFVLRKRNSPSGSALTRLAGLLAHQTRQEFLRCEASPFACRYNMQCYRGRIAYTLGEAVCRVRQERGIDD